MTPKTSTARAHSRLRRTSPLRRPDVPPSTQSGPHLETVSSRRPRKFVTLFATDKPIVPQSAREFVHTGECRPCPAFGTGGPASRAPQPAPAGQSWLEGL